MKPVVRLVKSFLLPEFPSGSSINFYEGKLYLIGDDANHVLVLDTDYSAIESIQLFDHPGKRIPKSEKTDMEASAIVNLNGVPNLLILGSSSEEIRKKMMLVPLRFSGAYGMLPLTYAIEDFISRVKVKGNLNPNIEGMTSVGEKIVLANRGNQTSRENHIIITDPFFWENPDSSFSIFPLILPVTREEFIGVSGLCYMRPSDILWLTFSMEETGNAYDDGPIGDSYLGWICNVSKKLNDSEWGVDGLINLRETSNEFTNEKIEGLCIEFTHKTQPVMHMVSDNDDGESKLFKLMISW